MRKRLETHLIRYRALPLKQSIVWVEAAVEIRPLDHPRIEGMCHPIHLRWRRKGMEAFGGKGSLTRPDQAGETPSAGNINANHRSLDTPAPRGDLLRKERGKLLPVLSVLYCDGMKTLLGTADIHTDDDGTRFVLTHTDSRAGQDVLDRCLFSLVKPAALSYYEFAFTDYATIKDSRPL